ncbi:flagellar basal-body rod protein FlgF [Caenimonas koreensis]|uniref:Flagellar basal-body rod protein FlgF n=1 Tax=Caenimonas koreensis DSM 17982 TaxID=1121255 RepID=A0A844BAS6_9BURK|nr:flagellar basal-body rod protein FlgF [Caenimonas koreensis]MRD48679.1 flagellar basal-body rod protein FlgF [Caenimonas koreensis DSM 17982]
MLSSIYIGMTGLQGFSQGLRVIANNTANLNTPGFKSSTLQFADMFYSNSANGSKTMQVGYGLNTAGTMLNFEQGELRQTGNNLDLAVDGQGLFTVRDTGGALHYTRAGQFTFNSDGVMVSRVDGSKVMGQDPSGAPGEITIAGHQMIAGKATTTLNFAGNLSSTDTDHTVQNVKVVDTLGIEHTMTLVLTQSTTTPGTWSVELKDGATSVGTGTLVFSAGAPTPGTATVNMTYSRAGYPSLPLKLDFSKDVYSFGAGTDSQLVFTSQDGWGAGSLTGVSFDDTGTMVMSYSNGQTVKGVRLLLGRFDSLDAVSSNGNNQFDATNNLAWHIGTAGTNGFGAVRSGMVELSNVDLSQEFSDLVIMQRGYQASSQVISTANEMLQQLFQMSSK